MVEEAGRSPGVGPGRESIEASIEAFRTQARSINANKDNLKLLTDKLNLNYVSMNRLAEVYKNLNKIQDAASVSAELLSAKIAKNSGIMSEAEQKSAMERRSIFESAMKDIAGTDKESSTKRTFFIKGIHDLEIDLFRNRMKQQQMLGQHQVSQGKLVEAGMDASIGKFKGMGQALGETTGAFMGLSAAQIGAVAGVAGALMAVWMAIVALWKNAAEGADNLAKAGVNIAGAGVMGAMNRGFEFQTKLGQMMFKNGFIAAISSDKLQELVSISMNEYLPSIEAQGVGYRNFINSTTEGRMQLAVDGAQFVAQLALVGRAFGLTEEQAVALGTKMGVATRSGFAPTTDSFTKLLNVSQRFGLHADTMVSLYSMIGEVAAYSGRQGEEATSELNLFSLALGNISQKTPGFMNMTSKGFEDMLKTGIQFASQMDEIRVAAITTSAHPGESFNTLLSRVTGMTASQRLGQSVSVLIREQGLDFKARPDESAFALSKMLGFESRNLQDMLRFGKLAQSVGNVSEKDLRIFEDNLFREKMQGATNVGAAIAMGADPNKAIATMIADILKLLIGMAGSFIFKATDVSDIATKVTRDLPGGELFPEERRRHLQPYNNAVYGSRATLTGT